MEMMAPIPEDETWKVIGYEYDKIVYGRICSKFGVGPSGLGYAYCLIGSPGSWKTIGAYDPNIMPFTLTTKDGGRHRHIDYIAQDDSYTD